MKNNITDNSFALDDFLKGEIQGHALQRSDIVLIQSNESLSGRGIRWATSSSFTHASLIFALPQTQQGFNRSFLIESSSGGVDLTALDYHTDKPATKTALVVLRLERDWFDESLQKRVRGELLNSIKAHYDYLTMAKIAIAFLTSLVFGKRSAAVKKVKAIIRESYKAGRIIPMQFICSGFVQFGFWHTVCEELPELDERDVFFGPEHPDGKIEKADLFTITPAELFQSEKLSVKYVIAGGRVYQTDSRLECQKILDKAEAGKLVSIS